MSNLPKILTSGAEARLIPTVADSKKEERISSILLSAMMSVPCFCRAILAPIGERLGTTAKVQCFTEVKFALTPERMEDIRPDGLIIVSTGKRSWSAIVEAKVDKNEVEHIQLKNYLALAKMNGIDAVITISNQMIAHPSHHPLKIGPRDRKGVDLFHLSWMKIKTTALLELGAENFSNAEQRWILREVTRYLEHDSSGVLGFAQMNSEWKEIISALRDNVKLRPNSDGIESTIGSWHHEARDLCLLMSRELRRPVEGKLSGAHKKDPLRRLNDDSKELINTGKLSCTLKIEGANDLLVTADLRSRTIACSMTYKAPTDKVRHSARINWLTRQLAKTENGNVMLHAHWPGRAGMTRATLKELRDAGGPEPLIGINTSLAPHTFEVCITRDLMGRFSQPKKFIGEIENLVPEFYAQVGQHIIPFQESAPKVKPQMTATEEAEIQVIEVKDIDVSAVGVLVSEGRDTDEKIEKNEVLTQVGEVEQTSQGTTSVNDTGF